MMRMRDILNIVNHKRPPDLDGVSAEIERVRDEIWADPVLDEIKRKASRLKSTHDPQEGIFLHAQINAHITELAHTYHTSIHVIRALMASFV
jgi:hypothetical protein